MDYSHVVAFNSHVKGIASVLVSSIYVDFGFMQLQQSRGLPVESCNPESVHTILISLVDIELLIVQH